MDEARSDPGAAGAGWEEILRATGQTLERGRERLAGWIDDHRDGIAEVASGLAVVALLYPRMRELSERFEDSEWAYVLERLEFLDALALMMLLDDEIDGEPKEAALDYIEAALHEPQFLAEGRSELEAAALSEAQRLQIRSGLQHFEKREFVVAVPLLIVALEGAFTGEAERRELVRRVKSKMTYTDAEGKEKTLLGTHQLFGLLDLEDDLLAFLRREVYGARGNAFRHGTAEDGHRAKALSLVIALVAYLDLLGDREGALLAGAFERQGEAQALVAKRIGLTFPAPAAAS